MRTMPKQMTDPTDEDMSIPIPSLAENDWDRLVLAMIGRDVSPDEVVRISKMAAHNWTARIVAEKIIGRDLTTEEVTAAHEANKK